MRNFRAICAAALAGAIAGCAATGGPPRPGVTAGPAAASGYLTKDERPDSLRLVPPPPAPGSAAQARDDAAAKAAVALQGGERWRIAASDADLTPTHAAETFSCALGVRVTAQAAPHLATLLARSIKDLGLSTYGAKTKYMRPRPFTVDGAPTCTPKFENVLRRDGSYPSGHSSAGWGWALILAEIVPDRADAILARGRAIGESRVVCNVHWLSDTEEGRIVGAAVVAKLHGDPQFRADLAAARDELAALRKDGAPPDRDCAAEAAALSDG